MKKIQITLKDFIKLSILFIIVNLIFAFVLAKYGNTSMRIDEYIFNECIMLGQNVGIEQKAFWILTFIGIIYIFLFIKNTAIKEFNIINESTSRIIILVTICLGMYIYKGYLPSSLLYIIFCLTISTIVFKDFMNEILYMYIFLVFDISSIYYIFSRENINTDISFVLSIFILFFLMIYMSKIKKYLSNKILLCLQILSPLVFLIYLKNKYLYNGEIITIKNTLRTDILIYTIVILLVIYGIYFAYKNWNATKLSLSIAGLFSLVNVTSFLSVHKYMWDNHHNAEYVLPFKQVVEHGNIPYINYFPISGMFSFFVGGVQSFLGLKTTEIPLAISLFSLLCSFVVLILLTKYLSNEKIFFIALLVTFGNVYVRPHLLIIYILVLFLPKLREKVEYWLLTWGILSYIIVFFYPVFGLGAIIGLLPLTIRQIYKFFKGKIYIKSFKNSCFLILFTLEILIFIISIPSILGLIRHTLIYAYEGNIAETMSRFGQSVPNDFLICFDFIEGLRNALWYISGYTLNMFILFILSLIFIKSIKNIGIKNAITDEFSLLIFSILFMLLVISTLTVKRQAPELILVRSGYILVPCILIIFYLIFEKYIHKNYSIIFILSFLITLANINVGNGLFSIKDTFSKTVSIDNNNYTYISEEKNLNYKNCGIGFLPNIIDNLNFYQQASNEILKYDRDRSFIGLNLGYLSILDLRTTYQASMFELKSSKRVEEFIKQIEKNKPVIFTEAFISTFDHMLIKWLITTKDYSYVDKYKAYIPNDLLLKMNLKAGDKEDSVVTRFDWANAPATVAKSYSTIKKNYNKTDVDLSNYDIRAYETSPAPDSNQVENICELNLNLNKTILGLDADYIYIELARENGNRSNLDTIDKPLLKAFTKKYNNPGVRVNISWEVDENSTTYSFLDFDMDDGRLFIPLDGNPNYLLNKHNKINLKIRGLEKGEKVYLNKIEFLKSKDF